MTGTVLTPLILALPPPLGLHTLGSAEFDPLPCLMAAAAAVLYLWGAWRVNRMQPRHPWATWRTACFLGGLVTTLVAIETFIGVYDDTLFWDHMVQHLLLVMVAGALLAVGAPLRLCWRASTGRTRDLVAEGLRSPVARFFDHPLVPFVLYAVVIPLTHLTSLYNLVLENEAAHNLEHLLYVVIGYLLWRQVFPYEPSCHRMHPGLRLAYLAAAVPVDTFTGLTLINEAREIFPVYVSQHRTWGPSLVMDLHLGGTIMWVGGDTLMLLAMIPVAIAWVRFEDRRAARVDSELEALMLGEVGEPGRVLGEPGASGGSTPVPAGAPRPAPRRGASIWLPPRWR